MIRYANVDGQLREPATGLKGICTSCGNSLIAKCGPIKSAANLKGTGQI
jgi:competence protein CoiA